MLKDDGAQLQGLAAITGMPKFLSQGYEHNNYDSFQL